MGGSNLFILRADLYPSLIYYRQLCPKSIMLSCLLECASEQVSDKFAGVCDKLTTFSG